MAGKIKTNVIPIMIVSLSFLSVSSVFSSSPVNSDNEKSLRPPLAEHYLDLMVKYAVYTPSIWKTDARGGFWGDGIG